MYALNKLKSSCNDCLNHLIFFSVEKISKVTARVLVIHGTEDEVIDFSHGLAMYERCLRPVEPLWVEGDIDYILLLSF